MKKFICVVCGYIHEGNEAPIKCPICGVGADQFKEMESEMQWADEHKIGVAQGVDEKVVEGLRANFMGECTEVGMYLAMSRQADREGHPEVGEAYKRIAFEEAEHAAKFAELLGEVVVPDTKANLRARVDAEFGACQGKKDLATLAKQLNLDAIHDTVHEMCKDEARHGRAFKGLLDRYFGDNNDNDEDPFEFKKFELIKRVQENDVITSFYFKRVDGKPLAKHKAGQFLSIKPVKSGEHVNEVRQYSLSMKPGEDFYRISVKKEEKGLISRYIHENLNVGDVIEATSPLGEFILKEGNNDRPLVLLSGGIGITPVMSMLYEASEESRKVIFGQAVLNSTAHTFKAELEKIKKNHSNVDSAIFYQTPLENDVKGEDYDFEGFMSKEWIESLPKNAEFYFCGPLGFMKYIYNTLIGMGIKEDSINYEMFGPSADLKDM